jgi:hypothetical protein
MQEVFINFTLDHRQPDRGSRSRPLKIRLPIGT